MPSALFLLLRRIRLPLIVLISTYAVSILGLVLIPGQDAEGKPWHMDFFHAFYFVSFMGSTIGFGEIPYPFTDAQRMWTSFTIYATVISWLYAIGVMLNIMQDPAFRRVVTQTRFERSIRRLKDPFYLVFGYGDTGSMLVRALTMRNIHVVVVDIDPERIADLQIEDLGFDVPGFTANAADPNILRVAGINHPRCIGVIALTNDDQANLTIALSSKLLTPHVPLICRAEYSETEANMASFDTDHIINPFATFASLLAESIHAPHMNAIYEWLTSPKLTSIPQACPAPQGRWVICGYGRFGKAIEQYICDKGVDIKIIEALPEKTAAPADAIIGKGTEADTLQQAGIETAKAIVAGTDNGADNLSILLTARELNPDLFIVARQDLRRNTTLFEAAKPDLIIQPSRVMARKVLALIINPLLKDFLLLMRQQDDRWAQSLILRINEAAHQELVDTWNIVINKEHTPALHDALADGQNITLGHLLHSPHDRNRYLSAVPLLLKRGDELLLLPDENTSLKYNDRILVGGTRRAEKDMRWIACNYNMLDYVVTGYERPAGILRRKLS